MLKYLSPRLQSEILFLLYRWRFFLVYIVIGVGSLVFEFMIRRLLLQAGVPHGIGACLAVAAGVFFAYWLNVRFNFKIPPVRRRHAFMLFVSISLLSLVLNYLLRARLTQWGIDYELGRLGSSAVLFSFAYLLHRRFSFRDYKQVGVAVYVNSAEDIRLIRQKVGMFPSFIHVDIVDETFNTYCTLPATMRMEVVRAYWEDKEVHAHVMSSQPRRWLKDVLAYCDVAIFHIEGVDDLPAIIAETRQAGRRVGLAVRIDTPIERLRPHVSSVDLVLLLAIAEPGRSGQVFQMAALERLAALNKWPERRRFEVCVDGGVNERNISLLTVEKVVSGYSVLNHVDPRRQIMRLQTSSNYEAI
jgi:pentose-5-phosphate-3-epimerase